MDKQEITALIKESEEFIKDIIKKKYCHPGESSWEDVVNRFRNGLKEDEEIWKAGSLTDLSKTIPDLMQQKKYIPAGSVLYGYKHPGNVSLSNCYYNPITHDSIEGIYEFLKKQARTYSWRGGVGTDISILRPKDTKVNNSAITSSGSVSFMPLLSESTNTIGQNGRRGAHIIIHSDWHPDIIDFVKCKSKPEEVFDYDFINKYLPHVYYANISVKLSDQFFKAVENDADWELKFPDIAADKDFYDKYWNGDLDEWIALGGKVKVYKVVKARELLDLIAESAWKGAEPGVLYWDQAIKFTPLAMIPEYKPKGVNPCGEQILGDWQNCNLHAINLSAYVSNPFTKDAKFEIESFLKDIISVYEFGDYIVSINTHPLEEQQTTDEAIRKVGIEFTALADMLAMLGIKYGSNESLSLIGDILLKANEVVIEANIKLAKSKGRAPVFEKEHNRKLFANSPFFKRLANESVKIKKLLPEIKEYGLRNAAWFNNGPTGSVSIVANNCTSGIEPLFKLAYMRRSRLLNKETTVIHLPLMLHIANINEEDLDNIDLKSLKKKYNYVEADELKPIDRIKMQATLQKYFTDSISSTVNLPETAAIDDVKQIYIEGWKHGLKGITIYRAGSLDGILESLDKKDNIGTDEKPVKIKIPPERDSFTYTMLWKRTKIYITVPYVNDKLVEIFAKLPPEASYDEKGNKSIQLKLEREANWTALCRVISTGLKYNVPTFELIKALDKSSNVVGDLPNILARTLKKSISKITTEESTTVKGEVCPICGAKTLVQEGGCKICKSCGYSKCE